jgi:hypothetical protein
MTYEVLNQIYDLADQGRYGESFPTYEMDDGAGNNISLLRISGTPEGCENEPVEDAGRRLATITQRYASRPGATGGGKKGDLFFLIYRNDMGELGVLVDKAQGTSQLQGKMGTQQYWQTSTDESTTLREEDHGKGAMVKSTKKMWEPYYQLYNRSADRWVVKVDKDEYHSAVVPV